MNDKRQLMTALRDEFNRWEELLAGMSEAQITAPHLPTSLSIKDVLAHLMAWQQISIARLEAARLNREPIYPGWPAEFDPDSHNVDHINAWIYETYRDQPWSSVYPAWQAGFLQFLQWAETIPEHDLLGEGRYPWLHGYALAEVLLGSYEHHHIDHLEPLLAWLHQYGNEETV